MRIIHTAIIVAGLHVNLVFVSIYLSYVDDGRNPDLFTQHQLEKTLGDYQAVQRKTETYKVCTLNVINNVFHFISCSTDVS